MADILLLQPRYEKNEETTTYPTSIPLGLGYLAAVLEQNNLKVKVVDMNVSTKNEKQIVEKIIEEDPKILGISVSTPLLPQTYRLAIELKRRDYGGVMVYGGPHITSKPDSIIALSGDFGLKGDGERGFRILCSKLLERGWIRDLFEREIVRDTPNLITNNGKEVLVNKEVGVENLDTLPFPARHLFETEKYLFTHILCSRGCPYKCSYCSMADTGYRLRSVENVVEEIIQIKKECQNTSIGFGDDVFTLKKSFVQELCKILKKKRVGVRWSCTTRADLVDEELLKEMYSAGCWYVSFGVESGVERIRYSTGKRITNKQYMKTFDLCRKIGLKTRAYAIFGHPREGEREVYETIKFVKGLQPDDVFFSLMSLYPGTKITQQLLVEGVIPDDVWERNMINGLGAPVCLPEGVGLEDMKEVLTAIIEDFYLTPKYVLKKILKARSVNELKDGLDFLQGFISTSLSI